MKSCKSNVIASVTSCRDALVWWQISMLWRQIYHWKQILPWDQSIPCHCIDATAWWYCLAPPPSQKTPAHPPLLVRGEYVATFVFCLVMILALPSRHSGPYVCLQNIGRQKGSMVESWLTIVLILMVLSSSFQSLMCSARSYFETQSDECVYYFLFELASRKSWFIYFWAVSNFTWCNLQMAREQGTETHAVLLFDMKTVHPSPHISMKSNSPSFLLSSIYD